MGTLTLDYALPVSFIRVEGTVTETRDAVASGQPERTPDVAVLLQTGAEARSNSLSLKTGRLRDTSVALEFTEDGRLVSSDLESTGQLGKVVLGVVGAGAAVAGVMLSPVPLVSAGMAAALAGAKTADDRKKIIAEKKTDPAIEKYRESHSELDDLRHAYETALTQAIERIGALGGLIVNEPDPLKRWEHIAELRQLESVEPSLEAQLDRLVAHFSAWRASKITTRTETHQRCFNLDTLRNGNVKVVNGKFESSDATVTAVWNDFHVAVTMEPVGEAKEMAKAPGSATDNELRVRIPRRVTVSVWEKAADGKAVLREEKSHLVVDDACDVQVVKLRRSLWAKRSVKLKFSDLGALVSYSHAAESSAAAAAGTLGALPETLAGSLETAAKIQTHLNALRSHELDRELDRIKKQVELKQKEIEMAGLRATERDTAELERLKQQAEIAEKRKALVPTPEPTAAERELAELRAEIELAQTRRAASVARRELAAEGDLAALRLETERLEAIAKARALEKG